MNQIKVIKLVNGDDIVCNLPAEQLPEPTPLIRLEKPLQIKYVPQLTARGLKDYIALIKWTAYTNDKIVTVPKDKIMTITNASEEMIKSYFDVSEKYELISDPESGNYKQEKLDKESNDTFNELWDSFRDSKKTIH